MPQGFIIHTDAVNSLLNMIINISIDTNCNILLLISFTNKKQQQCITKMIQKAKQSNISKALLHCTVLYMENKKKIPILK